MPGKKAHKSRIVRDAGIHGVHQPQGRGRKSAGETEGQYTRDPKRRQGQYGQAGNPPLIKK